MTPPFKYEEYSNWSRMLARTHTRKEIEREIRIADRKRNALSESHHNAIKASTSMGSQGQRRAQSRNAMVGNYDRLQAYISALELYDEYPQHTKEGTA